VTTCTNNYVWIQHEPGEEWSKYSHVATGTVTGAPPSGAGLGEGDAVVAGQFLGNEGNVGMATGANDGRHPRSRRRGVRLWTTIGSLDRSNHARQLHPNVWGAVHQPSNSFATS
jgi:hypothetical protein